MNEVPNRYRIMLDEAAGKTHSATGSVMSTLVKILIEHERDVIARICDLHTDIDDSRSIMWIIQIKKTHGWTDHSHHWTSHGAACAIDMLRFSTPVDDFRVIKKVTTTTITTTVEN